MMNIEVIIVGGGLSGLYAARLLEKAGINCRISLLPAWWLSEH